MATKLDDIVQNVVDNGNKISIQSESTSQGMKHQLNSSISKNKSNHMETNEALSIMKEMLREKSVKDEYALFGEQVGMQIRGLPSPYTRKVARQMISTVLFDAEMGKYDYPPGTSLQPCPGTHFYSQSHNSGVPMYAHFGKPISSKSAFHLPFPSPSQISTPLMSPAPFTDGSGTSDSESFDNLLMEI